MDISRRLWPSAEAGLFDGVFKAVTRPRERYTVPAATYYCLGMLLVTVWAPRRVAQAATLVLGVGDPAASAIGRRVPLFRFPNRKSLGGTLGFIAVSMATVTFWLVRRVSFSFFSPSLFYFFLLLF